MPYSYGKEKLRQDTRVSAQRRESIPPLPAPQRAERRETSRPLAAPYRVERRESGRPLPAPYRAERRETFRPLPAPRRVIEQQESRSGHTRLQMVLGICLILFSLVVVFNRVFVSHQFPSLGVLPSSQVDQTDQNPPIPLSFPVAKVSRNVTAFSQADKAHYNNEEPEWSKWSYSACSGCAMAALMDAYGANINGRPLNCGDTLETEYRISVYNPVNDWGLIRGAPDELAKTAAQFGFTGHYTQKLSLDDLITLGNAGIPSIVRIPTHVMILTGGDSQNVFLADSGGLHLSKVTRNQFLHGLPGSRLYAGQSWMAGWYVILTPNKNNT